MGSGDSQKLMPGGESAPLRAHQTPGLGAKLNGQRWNEKRETKGSVSLDVTICTIARGPGSGCGRETGRR